MIKFQLVERLSELPYRLRRRISSPSQTWPIKESDLARIKIIWPERYQWSGAKPIVSAIKDGLVKLGVVEVQSSPQNEQGVVALDCFVDGRRHAVALDYSDHPTFINDAALTKSDLYVKCQFQKGGYKDDRIIRGGYPVVSPVYYKYYRAFRANYGINRYIDVLGRFGYTFQGELRKRAVHMLDAAPGIDFVGGDGMVRYSRFLREAASARLCLHLPGNGPFTYRLPEFLGLGSCMISLRFTTELHVPLEAGIHYVEVADDLSDLIDKCHYYLRNDKEREKIANAGRDFFDRYLHCDEMAGYYVRSMLDRLGP